MLTAAFSGAAFARLQEAQLRKLLGHIAELGAGEPTVLTLKAGGVAVFSAICLVLAERALNYVA